MPKMKTHRGAAKRIRVTGKKKLRRKKAYDSHLFTDKSAKRKRHLGKEGGVASQDAASVRRLLGIGNQK
ncbi:MAG: 50S ribosomal protein L35 [Actinobacteria bacterium]|nr:50S ribosomal protein L35 [Actinomycetota bacterium]